MTFTMNKFETKWDALKRENGNIPNVEVQRPRTNHLSTYFQNILYSKVFPRKQTIF